MDLTHQIINYRQEGLDNKEVADRLKLTHSAVKTRAHKLIQRGLISRNHTEKLWGVNEIAYLTQNYTSKSIREIANELQRGVKSVRWKYDELNLSKNKCKYTIPEEKRKLTPELGYLIGVLLGDGFVTYRKSKVTGGTTYLIGLGTIDKEFAEKFADTLRSWSGMKVSIFIRPNRPDRTFPNGFTSKCKTQYHVYAVSKSYGEFFKKLLAEIDILKTPDNFKKQVIQGLFDSEGCVTYQEKNTHRLTFSNRNVSKLTLFKKLLEEKGFHPTVELPTETQCGRVMLHRKVEFYRFLDEIGCTIQRKTKDIPPYIPSLNNGYPTWSDTEKQRLLTLKKEGKGLHKIAEILSRSYPTTKKNYYRLKRSTYGGIQHG